jgi:hypothetical protein
MLEVENENVRILVNAVRLVTEAVMKDRRSSLT